MNTRVFAVLLFLALTGCESCDKPVEPPHCEPPAPPPPPTDDAGDDAGTPEHRELIELLRQRPVRTGHQCDRRRDPACKAASRSQRRHSGVRKVVGC